MHNPHKHKSQNGLRNNSMIGVNEIDAKILKALLKDGRKSLAEIAKECSSTKNKIWKRHHEMEKKGIITGATVQVNFAALGYDALATLLISVDSQQVKQIMENIGRLTEIRTYRQYNNVYNIRAVSTLKNLNELDHVKNAIRRYLPANGLRTYIWTDVKNIPENLNLTAKEKISNQEQEPPPENTVHTQEAKNIDELDFKIIEALSVEGRAPFHKIAQEIGTSTDTVLKRYNKLRKRNIMKVVVQINPNVIGYQSILDFNIALASLSSTSQTLEKLARIPDVIILTKTSGEYDLQVTAMIRDIEQMFEIQEEIAKTPGVTKMDTSARKIPPSWPTPKQYMSTF
jgi:Lrp/AsnC family transcriptional regulator, regulator for asnA, asnC and gidA